MGGKQSSAPASDGRTRAYSGSDIPSSSNGTHRPAGGGGGSARAPGPYTAAAVRPQGYATGVAPQQQGPSGSSSAEAFASQHALQGPRTRSTGVGGAGGSSVGARTQSSFNIPSSSSGGAGSGSQDSGSSTPEEGGRDRTAAGHGGPRLLIGSLPSHLSPHLFGGFKCPVCSKFVSTDEMDLHLVMCLTKPRITYNEDVLTKDAGECAICLEELTQGDTIARLPCLCIYHKACIDEWFEVNRSCPEHPAD
ncbi:E3 ubiquitin-protein ligase ZNRF2 [Lissotriton helveticus]